MHLQWSANLGDMKDTAPCVGAERSSLNMLLPEKESWPGAAGSVGCDPHTMARPPYYGSTSILWPAPGVDISPHAALPRLHSTPLCYQLPRTHSAQNYPLHFLTLPCCTAQPPLSKTCQAAAFCPLLAPTLLLLPRRTKCNAALSELVKLTLYTGHDSLN